MKKLIFKEDFKNQTELNLNNWNIIDSGGGFGNKELQYYRNNIENLYFENGALHLKAILKDHLDHQYTSAKITTKNKVSFKYGHFIINMKLPKGIGSWPALWFLGNNGNGWPKCGEIDLMEHLGRLENNVHFSLHSKNYNHLKGNNIHFHQYIDGLTDDYHKYEMKWTKEGFSFYVDNKLLTTINKEPNYTKDDWPFDDYFYLIINLAVGGNWGGEVKEDDLPFTFSIKSIEVYELE